MISAGRSAPATTLFVLEYRPFKVEIALMTVNIAKAPGTKASAKDKIAARINKTMPRTIYTMERAISTTAATINRARYNAANGKKVSNAIKVSAFNVEKQCSITSLARTNHDDCSKTKSAITLLKFPTLPETIDEVSNSKKISTSTKQTIGITRRSIENSPLPRELYEL